MDDRSVFNINWVIHNLTCFFQTSNIKVICLKKGKVINQVSIKAKWISVLDHFFSWLEARTPL